MKQLLFYDIDGTLLSTNKRSVPQSALDAIKQAQLLGHECYFCTGRSYGMRDELNYMNIDNAIICNGAGIVRHGELIYADAIDQDVAMKTLKAIEDLGGAFQVLDWKYGYQNQKCHDHFAEMFAMREEEDNIEDTFKRKGMKLYDEYYGLPVLKIDYTFDTLEQAEQFIDQLDPSLDYIGMLSYFVDSRGVYGEIMRKGVNKGTGIRHLVDMLNMSLEQTVGFGDSLNDAEMLETCHKSVVMGNGLEEMKAKADFVTKSVEDDGIAYAMTQLGII